MMGREFRNVVVLSLLGIALLLADAMPSDAHGPHRRFHGGRGRVFVTIGPTFYWGPPYPYWHYAYYAPPPYYVYVPPPVVVQEPPAYAQATPAPPPQGYWYYCPSAQAYYPTAPSCPEAWVKVPPRPE